MNNKQQFSQILVIEDLKSKRVVTLESEKYSIGRHSNNSIIIYSNTVSRYHATLLREKKQENHHIYWLIDGDSQGKKSQNGVFLNGKKIFKHQLKHGDNIKLGEDVKISYQIVKACLSNGNQPKKVQSKIKIEEETTLIVCQDKLEKLSNEELTRLASFPELSPNPILEIDGNSGEITYINTAASIKFKDLEQANSQHPLLKDLLTPQLKNNNHLLIREVEIGEEIFEEYVHYLNETQLIRIYLFEITERKQSEKKLQYQAFHDSLTGLPNRRFFNKKLDFNLKNAEKYNNKIAVMFIDLDRFKNINDSLGHSIGDRLLQKFAERIKSCLQPEQMVARWGGDEFTVLLPQITDKEEVANICQKILAAQKKPIQIGEKEFYVGCSIGIALYPKDGKNAENLIANADAALYRVKQEGKNNYQFYSKIMNSEATLLLRLENHLYQALEKGEFLLYYQPQMNLKTQVIYGLEALLRWQHPELGLVSPGKFIPLAEETGLIVPIGEWVIKTAVAQNKAWQTLGLPPIRIAVNLSARQFEQANLVEKVAEILTETGLQPHLLELEITETTLMHNVELARQTLDKLLKLGVHISMDDFGTGYSSLGYLKKFPFNTLKIDQSFIRELEANPEDLAIVSAVITLGRGFNLKVIAEGVETLEQLELLRDLQCEEIQGYWLSKPLKAEEVPKFLLDHNLVNNLT